MVENEREDYADVIVENGWSASPNHSHAISAFWRKPRRAKPF